MVHHVMVVLHPVNVWKMHYLDVHYLNVMVLVIVVMIANVLNVHVMNVVRIVQHRN